MIDLKDENLLIYVEIFFSRDCKVANSYQVALSSMAWFSTEASLEGLASVLGRLLRNLFLVPLWTQ